MDKNLKNKTVIVTGGARGLGLSIARNFLDSEAKVVIILDVEEAAGHAAAAELNEKHGAGKAVFIRCDVNKDLEQVFGDVISTYKTVDVLVNNAGWVREDSIKDTMNLNVVALVEWSMKFLDHMRIDQGGKGGTILNISSMYGFSRTPNIPFYVASKHAVLGFTKSMGHAKNFAKSGVRMVAICPGFTRTVLLNDVKRFSDLDLTQTIMQEPEAVGEGSVEVFKVADSGTAWLVEGGNPIVEVPPFVYINGNPY